jgi:prepilin-type N-terminal cleavage/methylation domain-containing protein
MNVSRAFTLIEILVVITLMGLLFSVLLLVFSRGVDSSLNLSRDSDRLGMEVSLFWDLQRKILGAKRLKIERDRMYLITSGGSFYQGIVKCAYIFKEGKLFYYEFPYPYGAIDQIEEEGLYTLGKFETFRVRAVERNREFDLYEGVPQFVKVFLNGREFLFETIR